MNEANVKKIEQLSADKEFMAKVDATETMDDFIKLLANEGVEVTMADLEAAQAQCENGELDESALENVAGGLVPELLAVFALASMARGFFDGMKCRKRK